MVIPDTARALPPDQPLFRLDGVRQERAGRATLDGIALTLPVGGVTALVGPSGAGKTSLLRLLNRLDDPIAGAIAFAGRPLASYPVRELRRRVGFVFQRPTMFAGTVAANLEIAHALGPSPTPVVERPALFDALRLVELDESYLDRDATRLSGGEQQRVSIARALIARPEVLLLDEPTSALDPEVADRLMATVRRLSTETSLSIVMVTHRLAEARSASTYAVMLEAGRVVEAGPTGTFFAGASSERARAYLAAGA